MIAITRLPPSAVHAPELYEPKRFYRNRRRDAYLRDNAAVDPAILAAELRVSVGFVRMVQRKIGVRKCAFSPRKADRPKERDA